MCGDSSSVLLTALDLAYLRGEHVNWSLRLHAVQAKEQFSDNLPITHPWLLHPLTPLWLPNLFQGLLGWKTDRKNKAASQSTSQSWDVGAQQPRLANTLASELKTFRTKSTQSSTLTLHRSGGEHLPSTHLLDRHANGTRISCPSEAEAPKSFRPQLSGWARTAPELTAIFLHLSPSKMKLFRVDRVTALLALNTCQAGEQLISRGAPANPYVLLGSIFKER